MVYQLCAQRIELRAFNTWFLTSWNRRCFQNNFHSWSCWLFWHCWLLRHRCCRLVWRWWCRWWGMTCSSCSLRFISDHRQCKVCISYYTHLGYTARCRYKRSQTVLWRCWPQQCMPSQIILPTETDLSFDPHVVSSICHILCCIAFSVDQKRFNQVVAYGGWSEEERRSNNTMSSLKLHSFQCLV